MRLIDALDDLRQRDAQPAGDELQKVMFDRMAPLRVSDGCRRGSCAPGKLQLSETLRPADLGDQFTFRRHGGRASSCFVLLLLAGVNNQAPHGGSGARRTASDAPLAQNQRETPLFSKNA